MRNSSNGDRLTRFRNRSLRTYEPKAFSRNGSRKILTAESDIGVTRKGHRRSGEQQRSEWKRPGPRSLALKSKGAAASLNCRLYPGDSLLYHRQRLFLALIGRKYVLIDANRYAGDLFEKLKVR